MVNGSFVFGLDEDDESVFDRTVAWAIGNGVEKPSATRRTLRVGRSFEPLRDWIIGTRRLARALPILEAVLGGFGRHRSERRTEARGPVETEGRELPAFPAPGIS